jgi:hypothetical protein
MSEQKRCELHGTVLKSMEVRVTYGSPVQNDDFKALVKARSELFPNARSHVLGGCTLGGIGPDYEALVCSECRKAEKKWRARTGLPTEPQIGGFFVSGR